MWGARQHTDKTWRLCERKGRTILNLAPDIPIMFSSQAKAYAAAQEMNNTPGLWPNPTTADQAGTIAVIINTYNGLRPQDWEMLREKYSL